jgi:hypothetical protein
MERPQVAEGGYRLQIGRGAANILNKQSLTAHKECSSRWGLGVGLKTPHHETQAFYEMPQRVSDLDGFFDK